MIKLVDWLGKEALFELKSQIIALGYKPEDCIEVRFYESKNKFCRENEIKYKFKKNNYFILI